MADDESNDDNVDSNSEADIADVSNSNSLINLEIESEKIVTETKEQDFSKLKQLQIVCGANKLELGRTYKDGLSRTGPCPQELDFIT